MPADPQQQTVSDAQLAPVWAAINGWRFNSTGRSNEENLKAIDEAVRRVAAEAVGRSCAASVPELLERWTGDDKIESPFNACQHKGYCLSLKAASAPSSESAPEEPYGSTELPYQFAIPQRPETLRLLSWITRSFGNEHPAYADVQTLANAAPSEALERAEVARRAAQSESSPAEDAQEAANDAATGSIPSLPGWSIKRHNGGFMVCAPDGSDVYAHPSDPCLSMSGNVLGMLAEQMVSAAESRCPTAGAAGGVGAHADPAGGSSVEAVVVHLRGSPGPLHELIDCSGVARSIGQANGSEPSPAALREYWAAHRAFIQARREYETARTEVMTGTINPANVPPEQREGVERRNQTLRSAADLAREVRDRAESRFDTAAAILSNVSSNDRQ